MRGESALCLAFGIGAVSAPSFAQPAANERTVSIEAAISATTDYRYRGVSLSGRRPALQANLTLTLLNGIYAEVWASTIRNLDGAQHEIDITIGKQFRVGPVDIDTAVSRISYVGADHLSYFELPATVSRQAGPWTLSASIAYVPPQHSTGGRSNTYVHTRAEWRIARTPLTLSASGGVEDGAFADRKVDWSLGASAELEQWTVALTYGGYAARRQSGGGVVLSAEIGF